MTSLSTAALPDQPGTARFRVSAELCPHTLCRLLGYVAQQDRLVDRLHAVTRNDAMRITFSVRTIDLLRAEILAAKMRNIVSVVSVDLSFD
jgi:hypothetical protein